MILDLSVAIATSCECPTSQEIKTWMTAALAAIGRKKPAIVAVRLVDNDEMQQLNHLYRQKNKPTNVLSFPCQLPDNLKGNLLGDLLICAPVVIQEAQEQHKTVQSHWAHMVVHGLLHLAGYDHVEPTQAEQMETLETSILAELGFPNPYGATLTHD